MLRDVAWAASIAVCGRLLSLFSRTNRRTLLCGKTAKVPLFPRDTSCLNYFHRIAVAHRGCVYLLGLHVQLNLDNNRLTSLSLAAGALPSTIESLTLNSNALTSFPDAVLGCTALVVLAFL